jgi:hypothetical protein
MDKGPTFWLIVAGALVAVIVGCNLVSDAREGRRYFMSVATYSAGRELIETTNAPNWVQAGSELRKDMADLLGSPTYVNKVLLGDDEGASGKDKASSRLILTNEQGRGLALRLRLRHGDKHPDFEVLSYTKITEPGGAANRSQPVRSGSNSTSQAAGSGR